MELKCVFGHKFATHQGLPPCSQRCLFAAWELVCWLLRTQQHPASVSQGRTCTDKFTCCHNEREAADPTFYLTQSQYTDTGPTSPSADPITPGAWQGSHWSANFEVTGMTRLGKIPVRTPDLSLSRRYTKEAVIWEHWCCFCCSFRFLSFLFFSCSLRCICLSELFLSFLVCLVYFILVGWLVTGWIGVKH